jgi:uncharacterized protein YegL
MHPRTVLPVYVVCDQSYSMLDHIDALNDCLLELRQACELAQLAAEHTRFCLIGFADAPEILLPLCRPTELARISRLSPRTETNFAATFTFLREAITCDVEMLKKQSHRVCRPFVFFLSDGQPTDPTLWPAAHARLIDPSWDARPNMIAFGFGDANPVTIQRIGTYRAFLSRDGVSLASALRQLTGAVATFAPDQV